MKEKFNNPMFWIIILAFIVFACEESDEGELLPPQSVADFAFKADEENSFLINFTNKSVNDEEYHWDFGDGNTSSEPSPSHSYEVSGSYEVAFTVTNGDLTDTMTKTVTIESPGGVPTGPSVITGGDMEDPDAWTVYAGAAQTIDYEFTDGVLMFTGEAEPNLTHQLHVWQAIEVEAGKEYLIYADVAGGNFNNAYLEIDIGKEMPEEGEQYDPTYYEDPDNPAPIDGLKGIDPANAKAVGINFWGGCGIEPFEGDIVEVGCDGPAQEPGEENPDLTNGRITFPESGTYYLVIKAGTWNGSMGDGVSIDNILLAPIVEE